MKSLSESNLTMAVQKGLVKSGERQIYGYSVITMPVKSLMVLAICTEVTLPGGRSYRKSVFCLEAMVCIILLCFKIIKSIKGAEFILSNFLISQLN